MSFCKDLLKMVFILTAKGAKDIYKDKVDNIRFQKCKNQRFFESCCDLFIDKH